MGARDDMVLRNVLQQQGSFAKSGHMAPQQRQDDSSLMGLLGAPPHQPRMAMREAIGMMNAQPSPKSQQQRDDALLAGVIKQAPMPQARDDSILSGIMQPSLASQQQRHDGAVLDRLLQPTPTGVAGKIWQGQDKQDDDTLLSLLGQGNSGYPRQGRDDVALESVLQQGAMENASDDANLKKLLFSSRGTPKKPWGGSLKVAPAPMLVAESISHFSLGWKRGEVHAEVVAGGTGKGSSLHQLFRPLGIAIDGQRGLLVADNGNHRVVRWGLGAPGISRPPRGEVIVDSQGYGSSWFDPLGLAVVNSGAVLVSVSGGIELWERGAQSPEIIATGHWPAGMVVDMAGTVVFADMLDHCIRQCPSPDNFSDVIAGCGRSSYPEAEWQCPSCGHRQSRRCKACRECSTPKSAWLWTDELHRPFGVAIDYSGSGVFIADSANHRVVHWAIGASEGIVVAGGKGPGNRMDQLHCPRGVAVDNSGALLVADTMNDRVLRFAHPLLPLKGSRSGTQRGEVVAGGNGTGHRINQLNQPNSLAFDAEGALYIADTGNHRVVRWHISQHT